VARSCTTTCWCRRRHSPRNASSTGSSAGTAGVYRGESLGALAHELSVLLDSQLDQQDRLSINQSRHQNVLVAPHRLPPPGPALARVSWIV
jgi:hypothetical protein